MPESDSFQVKIDERMMKLVPLCTDIAVEPGLEIAVEVIERHPSVYTLSITKKRKLKMDKEWTEPKFRYEDDFYGWRWIGNCFMIEDRHGEMLIGDQLPSTEDEARLVCRVANAGLQRGFQECDGYMKNIRFNLAYSEWVKAQRPK